MDGFERRRESKKENILSAALELFKEYGYNKVTIVEIAKKASVSQVSIYNFFNSKENLKVELLEKIMNDHLIEAITILDSNDSIKDKIEKLLAERFNYFKSFSSHFVMESIQNNDFTKKCMDGEVHKRVKDGIINLFEEGKKEGFIDGSITLQGMEIYMEIIQYYFVNKPSVIEKFDKNPELGKEIFSLFCNSFIKR